MAPTTRWTCIVLFLLIPVCVAVLYAHTLNFPFQFDDWMYLHDNPLITTKDSLRYPLAFSEFMATARSQGLSDDLCVNFVLRPFAYLTFMINHALDGFNPRGYRLVNIIIHAANSMMVFLLVHAIFKSSRREWSLSRGSRLFIAACPALLFAAHPLQTESVTYIVQRFTSMGAFFFLAAVLLHVIAWRLQGKWRRVLLRAAVFLLVLLGMLTKEVVFLAPLAMLLLDVALLGIRWRESLLRVLPSLLLMPLLPLLIYAADASLSGGATTVAEASRIVQFDSRPDYQFRYLLTQFPVIVSYLRLILLPMDLNVDPHLPLAASLTEFSVLTSFGFLLVLALLAVYALWHRSHDARIMLAATGVLWFFLTISISSSIIPLPDLMAEHHTYLPSVGIFIALAALLDGCRDLLPGLFTMRVVITAATLWITALSTGTWLRNEVWRTEKSLWTDAVKKSPGKARPLANLGIACFEEGDREMAEHYLRLSLQQDVIVVTAYENLTTLLNMNRRPLETIQIADEALRRMPNNPRILHNRGYACLLLNRLREAEAAFHQTISISPNFPLSHVSLGALYRLKKDHIRASHHYRKAASLGFTNPQIEAELKIANAAMSGDDIGQ